MKIFKNFLLVLSTGYIFVYFSEHLFWSRFRPDDTLTGWLGTWIVYSLMAFVFLTLISYFRVRNIWALFLAGAIFGWMGEGIVVQTAYELLPFSISFTGLAWHALITVWVGWYTVQKALLSSKNWAVFKVASLIGFFYGLWAISWWLEPEGGISSLPEFTIFSFVTTSLVIFAYWLANWSSSEPLYFNRWMVLFIGMIFSLYFFFITVPAAPIAMVILPSLFGFAYFGLRLNRMYESKGSLLGAFHGTITIWKYASLFALPATSCLVYMLAMLLKLQWQTNWILYAITTPLGFILFGISLYKQWRRKYAVSHSV